MTCTQYNGLDHQHDCDEHDTVGQSQDSQQSRAFRSRKDHCNLSQYKALRSTALQRRQPRGSLILSSSSSCCRAGFSRVWLAAAAGGFASPAAALASRHLCACCCTWQWQQCWAPGRVQQQCQQRHTVLKFCGTSGFPGSQSALEFQGAAAVASYTQQQQQGQQQPASTAGHTGCSEVVSAAVSQHPA